MSISRAFMYQPWSFQSETYVRFSLRDWKHPRHTVALGVEKRPCQGEASDFFACLLCSRKGLIRRVESLFKYRFVLFLLLLVLLLVSMARRLLVKMPNTRNKNTTPEVDQGKNHKIQQSSGLLLPSPKVVELLLGARAAMNGILPRYLWTWVVLGSAVEVKKHLLFFPAKVYQWKD